MFDVRQYRKDNMRTGTYRDRHGRLCRVIETSKGYLIHYRSGTVSVTRDGRITTKGVLPAGI